MTGDCHVRIRGSRGVRPPSATRLRLKDRVFHCEQPGCGLVLDRDLNAARNLAALASEVASGASTESCAGTLNTPAGNPRKTTTPSGVQGSRYRHGKIHRVKTA